MQAPRPDTAEDSISADERFSNLIARGDLAAMMETPDLRARLSGTDDEGWTPLHWAALYGHAEIAGFLLASGADADAVSKKGETPLMIAAESLHLPAFAVLLEAGARCDLKRNSGDTVADILGAQNAQDFLDTLRDQLALRASVLQKPLQISPSPVIRKRTPQ